MPGGARPEPQPRVVWPRIIGIAIAIAAQAGLYLGLRQISNVTMPAWAHHHARPALLPWPALVPVAVVGERDPTAAAVPVLPPPVLTPPAPIAEPPLPALLLQPSRR